MVQETGETRDAIIEDDNKRLQAILYENRLRRSPYWICIFAKPTRNHIDGKPVLAKHFKAYGVKPQSQVGMLIGEVDNSKGTIQWEINMPDVPFNYDGLLAMGAEESDRVVVETTTIPNAYIASPA